MKRDRTADEQEEYDLGYRAGMLAGIEAARAAVRTHVNREWKTEERKHYAPLADAMFAIDELKETVNPLMLCPRCARELVDFDGAGVLYHERCGYCEHATIEDGDCTFCGRSAVSP